MPANVVDSPRDEEKWQKAKSQAQKQGKSDNYAYIMGIYKNMNPSHEFKSAAASDVSDTSTMVAIYPPKGWRDLLAAHAHPSQADKLHMTLVYLGDTTPEEVLKVLAVIRPVVAKHDPFSMKMNGAGIFDNPDAVVRLVNPNGVGLNELRADVYKALEKAKLTGEQNHGFVPHMTLEYHEDRKLPENWERVAQLPFGRWTVNDVRVVRGDKEVGRVPLKQAIKESQMTPYEQGYAHTLKLAGLGQTLRRAGSGIRESLSGVLGPTPQQTLRQWTMEDVLAARKRARGAGLDPAIAEERVVGRMPGEWQTAFQEALATGDTLRPLG